ncbi:hypothetical protein GOBAR_AA03981 [Gossypium barbadense]|uniref:non-specific serine/threonine protein kinase n=1 Tax=Gossypium barbadense TaxID=3634 RepID=A0A2P5YM11_GOSBA|nr:hypothetical protein GOBAR_AA03981 [Gossypium barbadense]
MNRKRKRKHPISSTRLDDGTYAMKKVLIQNNEQLELVREEIRVSSSFSHRNLLPLLDHAIISVKLYCVISIFSLVWDEWHIVHTEAAKAVHKPTKVECLSGLTIKLAALGSEHTVVVTDYTKTRTVNIEGLKRIRLADCKSGYGRSVLILDFVLNLMTTGRLIKGRDGKSTAKDPIRLHMLQFRQTIRRGGAPGVVA